MNKLNNYKLSAVVNHLEELAKGYPNIHFTGVGDVYTLLNTNPSVDYTAFVLTPQDIKYNLEDDLITYSLYLFFVDRELDDQSNIIDIQTDAISFFHWLINYINDEDEWIITNGIINLFKEKFSSECAGAYLNLSISVPITECFDDYQAED